MADEFKRRDVFNRAADLVEKGWCKGRMVDHMSVWRDGSQPRYCAVGAVLQASGYMENFAQNHEEAVIPADNWMAVRERLMRFNDGVAKDKSEVVKALREVAATGNFKFYTPPKTP